MMEPNLKEAEIKLFWRILREVKLGTMEPDEAHENLLMIFRFTEQKALRNRIRPRLAEMYWLGHVRAMVARGRSVEAYRQQCEADTLASGTTGAPFE